MKRRALLAALGLTATAGCYTRFRDDDTTDTREATETPDNGGQKPTTSADEGGDDPSSPDTSQSTTDSDGDGKATTETEGESEAENTSDTEPEEIPESEDITPEGEHNHSGGQVATDARPRGDVTVSQSASTTSESVTVEVWVTNVSTTEIDLVEVRVSFSEAGHHLDSRIKTITGLRPGDSGMVSVTADFVDLAGVPDKYTIEVRPMDKVG